MRRQGSILKGYPHKRNRQLPCCRRRKQCCQGIYLHLHWDICIGHLRKHPGLSMATKATTTPDTTAISAALERRSIAVPAVAFFPPPPLAGAWPASCRTGLQEGAEFICPLFDRALQAEGVVHDILLGNLLARGCIPSSTQWLQSLHILLTPTNRFLLIWDWDLAGLLSELHCIFGRVLCHVPDRIGCPLLRVATVRGGRSRGVYHGCHLVTGVHRRHASKLEGLCLLHDDLRSRWEGRAPERCGSSRYGRHPRTSVTSRCGLLLLHNQRCEGL